MSNRHAVIIERDGYTEFRITDETRGYGMGHISGSEPWEDGINGPDRRVAEHKIVSLCEAWNVSTMEIHTENHIKTFAAEFDSKGRLHWTGKVSPKLVTLDIAIGERPDQDGEWYDAENGFETYADMLYATGKEIK